METLEKANEVSLNLEEFKHPSHSETKEDLTDDAEETLNSAMKKLGNLFKFSIEKTECINSNDLSEIQLNQIFIKLSQIKKKIDCSILSSDKQSPPSLQEKIIPNKLKTMNGFLFFSYCKVNEFKIPSNIYNANTGVNTINSNISTNDFKITNKIKDFNLLIMKDENWFILNSNDLNFKIPSLNFGTLAGYKFFSNFSVVDFENEQPLILFLVVYNYVCALKIYNYNSSSESNYLKNEKKYEILFQREFSNSNLLLFLGSEEVSKKYHKFYILSKPGQKMILFHCKYKKKLNKIKVTFEEKNLENSLKLPNEKIIGIKNDIKENESCLGNSNSNMLQLSRVIVTNSTELFFYDKPTNKIFSMNKYKFNKIKALNSGNCNSNNEKMEKCSNLGDWKNFLVMTDKQQEVSNLYLITDELINSSSMGNSILINIWKIKNNFNENKQEKSEKPSKEIQYENIDYEKIQTIQIKSSCIEDSQEVGMYNFSTIDEFHFALCLYEHDEILVFRMKSFPSRDHNQPSQSFFLIESIYELNFQELYACMFDYQILSDHNILELILYQEEEFLKYEIDLKKGIKTTQISVMELSNGKIYNNSEKNPNTSSNKSNCNLNSKTKSIIISSINKNTENPSPTSMNSQNMQIPISSPGEGDPGESKNLILDFKKSLSEKIITGIETKLDKLINSKMNMFAEGLNNKLSDVFSFMKKQTEELEDIRKKNNDAMINVTNVILKLQENVKIKNNNPQQVTGQVCGSVNVNSNNLSNNAGNINSSTNCNSANPYLYPGTPFINPNNLNTNNINNLNLYNTNPKLYAYMMNLGLNQNVMSMINSQSCNNNLSLQNDLTKRTQNIQSQPFGQFNTNNTNTNTNMSNTVSNCNIKNQNLQGPQNQLNMNLSSNGNQNVPQYNFPAVNSQNIIRVNQPYQNYAVGYNPNLFSNSSNQYLNLNYNPQNFQNLSTTGNCEIPTDNKYKEDQLVLEIMEKKFSEIKNEEEQLMKSILEGDINLSLDFKKENKEVINYSSDSKYNFFYCSF